MCGSGSAGLAEGHQRTHSALLRSNLRSKPRIGHHHATTRVRPRPRHQRCVLHRPVADKQTSKQTHKQTNKQTSKQTNSVEQSRGSGAAAASRCSQATRSRHDATCTLRVPIRDAAAYLEETQQLDVRVVRVRLRHVCQERLLGAGGRDLLKLQAGAALQRWMRCSCCAQCVPRRLCPMEC